LEEGVTVLGPGQDEGLVFEVEGRRVEEHQGTDQGTGFGDQGQGDGRPRCRGPSRGQGQQIVALGAGENLGNPRHQPELEGRVEVEGPGGEGGGLRPGDEIESVARGRHLKEDRRP